MVDWSQRPYWTPRRAGDSPAREVPWPLRLRLLVGDHRLLWLLKHGRQAIGTRIGPTTFEFTTADGRVSRCEATADAADSFGEQEPLLYDPGWPEHATLLRCVPGAPMIAEDGTIVLPDE